MTRGLVSIPVVGIAGGLFCVLLIYLTLQIRAGNDPAIGAGQPKAAPQQPRQVLLRRVIITRVIEEDAAPVAGGGSAVVASAPAASAPVSRAPAPAAPAPAPVVTGGS